jgi:hypothetical protein
MFDGSIDRPILYDALLMAIKSTLVLFTSHMICCSVIMYYDLSGQWDRYRLHRPKNASKAITSNDKSTILRNYLDGYQNFLKDLFLLFIPFMTFCYYYRYEEITGTFYRISCLFD